MATNGETATDLEPSGPMLNESDRHAGSRLLIADAGPIGPAAAESTLGFDPSFDALGDKKDGTDTIAKPVAGSPAFYTHAIDDDSLHLHLPLDDFEETGPGTMKLSMSGLDVDALRSVAGGRSQLIAADDDRGRLTLETRLAWLFEYLQSEATAAAFFAPGDKGIFAIQGLGYGSNWAILGTGLRWDLVAGWRAYAGYDAQFNRQQLFHIGSAGVDYAW